MTKLNTLFILSSVFLTTQAQAGLVNIPFNGTFDEASIATEGGLPAGDFDTIGGLEDVALFNLVTGVNEFYGSIFSPTDPADVFTVGIAAGLKLTGATIHWGTNLLGVGFKPFVDQTVPVDYRQQNTWGDNAPTWFFEESSTDPEIFTIAGLEDGLNGETGKTFLSAELDVTEGIYSSLLSASGTCAQSYSYDSQGFLNTTCVEGIDYKMTYTVESLTPISQVPEPTTLAIFALGLFGLVSRKTQK
ncbi:PEP-CTERM sorting domain-containing protein [Aliivibrio kagoshimensis]|uniref:PEP-CTERM sorting domain-containing protein n=1 Tax=Aliivibrio kagoshimensis TaxID=2910230 RepID=UPI003D0A4F2B